MTLTFNLAAGFLLKTGDLVRDLPCVQQASYQEGGPLLWILPLYLHVNQKSDDDDEHIILS